MKKSFKLTRIQSKRKWLFLLLLTTGIYFTWRVFFTLPLSNGWLSFIFGILLLSAELAGLYDLLLHFWNLSNLTIPIKPVLSKEVEFPEVDVFIATYNEPTSLIHKTLIGCLHMEYPEPSKVHIYVLDDGNRPEMANLCKSLNVGYFTRKENTHAKAGNINNALQKTNSPYVVTFDADMIPRRQFLMETIPYFVENQYLCEKDNQIKPLGFLQVPQSFYNVDCFQYRLFAEHLVPNEQNYFHREVQLGKNKSNSVIYSGSNTVINRKALEDVGGFATGIITEDIATGIKIQSSGYQCYALNTIQASGLSPYDLNGLIKQRQRWARGCIQTFRRINPLFTKSLTLSQRLNYFDSILYWFSSLKRLVYLTAPLLFSVFGVVVVDAPLGEVLLFWLPFYLVSTYAFRFFSGNVRTATWTNIYETILMPPLLSAILLESLGIKKQKFEVTPKTINLDKEKIVQWKLAIPHLILLGFSFIGIYRSLLALFTPQWESYLVILFWLLTNSTSLILVLFFIIGRSPYRESERILLTGDIHLTLQDVPYSFSLYDLSEQGISITSDFPHFIEPNLLHELEISIEGNTFTLPATFIRVDSLDNQCYKFAFTFKYLPEKTYQSLILALYDRAPQLPELTKKHSTLRHIWRNTSQRIKKTHSFSRKTPRIPLQLNGSFYNRNLKKIIFKDFNYTHLKIKGIHPPQQFEIKLKTNPKQSLSFQYKKPLKQRNHHLYELKTELSLDLIHSIQTEIKLLSKF